MVTSNKSQKLPAMVLAWENLMEVFVMEELEIRNEK